MAMGGGGITCGADLHCKAAARIDTITGPVNLPYGTTVEAVEDYLIHRGRQLCAVTSRKAHLYFARDDDGQGRERAP